MDTTNAIGLSLILEKTKEFHDKDIYHALAEVEKITGELFSIDEGASRTVISHDSWDFVLKVNTYEYEEEDVNAREECNYTSAKEYEVEDFLLPIKKFYCIGPLDFYIQPKITLFILTYGLLLKNPLGTPTGIEPLRKILFLM